MGASDSEASPLDRLVAAIVQSARYRCLCPDAIRRIGAQELTKRKSWKEAEKETRSRLHQIGGAYLESQPPYSKWIDTLRYAGDQETYLAELKRMMLCHASTRERLPILDTFYDRTLESIRPIRSVIDVACGFNALALPWIGVEEGGRYEGYDLYTDMLAFASEAMGASPFSPKCAIQTCALDLAANPPEGIADVALVLKFLPLLEQAGAPQMLAWLSHLNTRYALVSFPTRTLGGRNVGMASSYDVRFREILEQARWNSERFEFNNELCFLVELRQSSQVQ
jgi:16S rRNA (guanine(1405)-N(7))-methyltransferase